MLVSRRFIGIVAVIAAGAVALAGVSLLLMRQGGFGPWAVTLSWPQMDASVETQVLSSTDVVLDVSPSLREFSGAATINVVSPGGSGNAVYLLLNPGFVVKKVSCNGEPVGVRRYRERLQVLLPPDTTACELVIQYEGWPEATNNGTLVLGEDAVLLDKLQFWYPLDLKSFCALSVSLTVPESHTVVWSGKLLDDVVENGIRRVAWQEVRPILARGLALGEFVRYSRVQGGIRCNVYGRELSEEDAEACLSAMGDAHNFLSARLGTDNFEQLNLVRSPEVVETLHAGGPLLFTPSLPARDPDRLFADFAGQVARNWWGETVSGRWFSTRPEAGEWLVSGMSEFYAWQALRTVRGRRAYLRYIETRTCAPQVSVPMKTFNLGQRLRPGHGYDEELLRVRGGFTAGVLSAFAGPQAFDRACKNFMSVHRYTTVSFAALLHEITLSSEIPLDEVVRIWFDRPGTFDYRIESVVVEPERVHIAIENGGDIPAYVPMQLGIVTDTGYHTQTLTPGNHGETVSVSIEGTIQRVVLDPEFELGDMNRANNTWPRTEWPTAFSIASNGYVALLSQRDWGRHATTRLALFSRMDKSPEYTLPMDGTQPCWMQWDNDGRHLAFSGTETGVWYQGGWSPLDSEPRVPLGWYQGELITWDNSFSTGAPVEGSDIPGPGDVLCAAVDPQSGDVVYTNAQGHLVLRSRESERTSLIREGVYPAEQIGWRADVRAIVYFERAGDLVQLAVDANDRQVLLHRNYEVKRSRISASGEFVAWVDPAGLLRTLKLGAGEPAYISLPGEIVDFAWEGEEAVVALVAAIPRRLPMRYHATYSLWRIPVSTWEGVQLPYDPIPFAAFTSEN